MFIKKAPANIYETFSSIKWIFSYFSFFPFNFIGDPINGRLITTEWNLLIFIAWITFYLIILILNMMKFTFNESVFSTNILLAAEKINIIGSILSAIVVTVYQMRKRENIKTFFRVLNQFDEKVDISQKKTIHDNKMLFQIQPLKFQLNLSRHRLFCVAWVYITTMILNLSMINITIYVTFFYFPHRYSFDLLKTISYVPIVTLYNLVNFQFVFASLSLRERFKILDKNLKFYLGNSHKILESYEKRASRMCSLYKLVNLYDLLSDGIGQVNLTFTFQVNIIKICLIYTK